MATLATERKLFVGGEWVETGDWLEVRSPYSGEIVGRVAKAGADETKRAIDAAEQAMREPLPAHKRAEILVRVAMGLGRRHDEVARQIGDVLIEDDRVKAITFTGSGAVGWGLKERAPKKKVNLELGNATPVIVTADADLDAAAASMAANGFSFAGQSCISVQRIYVERPAYDKLVERLVPLVEALEVGDPADEETDVGPVIDEDAKQRILEWIEEARSGGADVLTG